MLPETQIEDIEEAALEEAALEANTDVQIIRPTLPKYSSWGSYPLAYMVNDHQVLCADCATDSEEEVTPFENWEDPHMYCNDCSVRIESAYADDDDSEEEESEEESEDDSEENSNHMTEAEFSAYFKAECIPLIVYQEKKWQLGTDGQDQPLAQEPGTVLHPDRPLRREDWNNTVDSFIQDDRLPESAGDWDHPEWLETYVPTESLDRYCR